MFSVNNFYDFMNSHYGLDIDGRNVLYFFRPHGSKNWQDLYHDYIDKEKSINIWPYPRLKGSMIFHDQEPFDRDMLNTYKWYLIREKNREWRITQPLEEVMLCRGCMHLGWQIFCHSEHHSEDIEFADRAGSINCYYFYHGLISRDWFRHWKHHGEISINKNWQYRFLLYARDCTGSRQYRTKMLEDLTPLQSMIDHDWSGSKKIEAGASATISVADSQTSAIHIVAETVFDRNKIHLTEKIFKPMVMMQPFIVFAGAGSLEYLKNYGFRTFGDVWDESYDLEIDHAARYAKILRLINKLSKASHAEIDHLLDRCAPIVEHNHRVFFSEGFEQQMLSELKSNMTASLERQAEKNKQYPGGVMVHQFECLKQRGELVPYWLIDEFAELMVLLQKHEPDRYHAILKQHAWLRDRLV